MRLTAYLLLTIGLLACLGCGANGSVNGSGTEHGSCGLAKIAFPF
jgi:hypothetical protein